jgi:hypothetical protein
MTSSDPVGFINQRSMAAVPAMVLMIPGMTPQYQGLITTAVSSSEHGDRLGGPCARDSRMDEPQPSSALVLRIPFSYYCRGCEPMRKEAAVIRMGQWLMLGGMMVAGMIGGAVSAWYFSGEPAFAQQRFKVVNAEEFLLVDKTGKTRAGLGLDAGGAIGLILVGKGGKTLHLSPDERMVLRLEENGKVVWSAP